MIKLIMKRLSQAKDHFGSKVIAVQYPLETGPGFNAIVDVLKMTCTNFHRKAEGR